ncbi:hypothetical protein GBAR_LOCUS2187 [Geodia barretti]|uniref:Ig-like domain-containing protein n=1 Tax=Geodia barretti TaxID=519541 RepID=A0AA35R0F9_GEOBA|nr:hypothetical protein GBAR_LOCUS2187 [Geodia barretti]
MKVECTVEVPVNATDITIGWFMDCQQLSNDSHVTIEPQVQVTAQVRRITSQLTINGITDDYAGKYTCNMLGNEEYVPGDQLELGDSDELELMRSLGACIDGDLFPNSLQAPEKCAVITADNPVPMYLVCEDPPANPTSTSTFVLSLSSSSVILSSIHQIIVYNPTVLLSPSPTTSQPTSTDPQDNNIEFTSPDSLNTVSLSLIAVSSLLTIIILLLSSFVLVKWCKGQKQNGTVNMCFQAPALTAEEPFYDSVKDRPEANSSIPSSAVPSQSNPAYGISMFCAHSTNTYKILA